MGRIFYIMGKSATGKDTLLGQLRKDFGSALKPIIMYTTRPIRAGEEEGVSYHFIDRAQLAAYRKAGKVIECRTYDTVFGPWSYATIDDGQIDLSHESYLMVGTLESLEATRNYYGQDAVVPLYVYVDDGVRLMRALKREMAQETPKYDEMCRRYLADQQDFSEANLERLGIRKRFDNRDFETCIRELSEEIRSCSGN